MFVSVLFNLRGYGFGVGVIMGYLEVIIEGVYDFRVVFVMRINYLLGLIEGID